MSTPVSTGREIVRLRAGHAYCGGVSVTIRFLDFKTRSHRRKLAEPADTFKDRT